MTTEAKASPGPWRWAPVDESSGQVATLLDSNGLEVCDFGRALPYDSAAGEPPSDADARLIAAAPKMLEALCDARPCPDRHDPPAPRVCWECRVAALLDEIGGVP